MLLSGCPVITGYLMSMATASFCSCIVFSFMLTSIFSLLFSSFLSSTCLDLPSSSFLGSVVKLPFSIIVFTLSSCLYLFFLLSYSLLINFLKSLLLAHMQVILIVFILPPSIFYYNLLYHIISIICRIICRNFFLSSKVIID